MLTYNDIERFVNCLDIINNRISIINQILGGTFQHPFKLDYSNGRYSCTFLDALVCDFGVYDCVAADAALASLDAWESSVWLLSRNGFITQR